MKDKTQFLAHKAELSVTKILFPQSVSAYFFFCTTFPHADNSSLQRMMLDQPNCQSNNPSDENGLDLLVVKLKNEK